MAKNTGRGLRSGTPRERSYVNPLTSMWTKPNSSSGKFMCQPRGDCCEPGEGCNSTRLRDRFQTWLDNTAFHHRWIANGPLWLICPVCRSMRDSDSESTWSLVRQALTPTPRS